MITLDSDTYNAHDSVSITAFEQSSFLDSIYTLEHDTTISANSFYDLA